MRVKLFVLVGKSVEGTVIDTTRRGQVSLVKWDNGNTEWHDSNTLVCVEND